MDSLQNIITSLDIQPLAYQVAGHTQKDKQSPGMLKHRDGYILKPLLKPARAENEIQFYEGLSSSPYSELQPFVPKFYGIAQVNIDSFRGGVLVLEDVADTLEQPCIMDIKIGRQTWDPYATVSKKESEERKYMECKRDLSFCIPGFQVYDSVDGRLRKFDKVYGKSLNKDTVPAALSLFLNLGKPRNGLKVIDAFLSQLRRIQEIMSLQSTLHLYSSSLLLTYDCTELGSKGDTVSKAKVYMIDFAHAYTGESHEQGLDKNYLEGIRSLENLLRSLRKII